ncbi:MAG TPA: DNA methyltransferase, partial [Candidatus Cloacimonadota bacterium]|nr:DNA methyltransferase [Candidatus Cloacimonadota bacterium]
MSDYLTIGEASKKLGISSQTLRRWDRQDKFKSMRHPINNFRVYSSEQINEFMKNIHQEDAITDYEQNLDSTSYFSTEFGDLYNCDVLDFFSHLKSQYVDLIFADPPYNIKKAEWDTFESQKKYIEWSMHWIEEAYRVLSPNGSLYICGFSEILADLKWATSGLFKGCKWLVWFYRNKANLGNDWGRSHESILHLRKSNTPIFNIDQVRIPYNEHTLKYPRRTQAESSQYANGKNDYIWEPNPLGAKPKDVFEIPTIANGSWEKFP